MSDSTPSAHEPWADHDRVINCSCGWGPSGDALIFYSEHLRALSPARIDELEQQLAGCQEAYEEDYNAALAESVRLREQLEAVRAMAEMAWDHRHPDAAGGQGARGYNEALRVVKAILEAK